MQVRRLTFFPIEQYFDSSDSSHVEYVSSNIKSSKNSFLMTEDLLAVALGAISIVKKGIQGFGSCFRKPTNLFDFHYGQGLTTSTHSGCLFTASTTASFIIRL